MCATFYLHMIDAANVKCQSIQLKHSKSQDMWHDSHLLYSAPTLTF